MTAANDALRYYKIHPSVKDPFFATKGSACFDIHACVVEGAYYRVNQDTLNKTIERPVKGNSIQIFWVVELSAGSAQRQPRRGPLCRCEGLESPSSDCHSAPDCGQIISPCAQRPLAIMGS